MNLTIKLLRTIGSPFASNQGLPESRDEALELYDYALKNKIGLFYLETLKSQGKLEELELKSEYKEENKKHNEQLITQCRIAKSLNSLNTKYAIFKSIMPYPITLSDVDVLHFCSDEEYKVVVKTLLKNAYTKPCGSCPNVTMLHDARSEPHRVGYKKDIYDIDLYKEVASSHVVYLDKRKLEKYITEIKILDERVKILAPEAELITIIAHSVIPEQLFTLSVYYATLYHLLKMNSEEIDEFIYMLEENKVILPAKVHFSIVTELHKAAHGFVPEKIDDINANIGNETGEVKNLFKTNPEMPHRYSWSTVIGSLLEKTKEGKFRRSAVVQIIHLLNPKFAKYVLGRIIWRRRRGTY